MAEANELSKEWLSVNSIYRPYDPKVLVMNDARTNAKRQSDEEKDVAGPSKLRQQPSLPKWFKKS
ncbi:unnamed protein product [Gongylonema pulchrum]|uniref:Uncharacterized protein n=1 Tax=Gongylonema pulchrum TaxID=637853 RepID=A0A183EBY2_9BILA|nr:unnamed protein product [Gongylonema pulchrum]